ncbi:caspase-6-like isoform X2 [Hippocampus zosterae]|uniref:caspase-6-like isoform X2 n=1 Tax=Hippocampus zosterae TaxID=109293 RepID=UPI00223CC371|nr:caspase-6-like isoform X2 [Hippocampus zosterae]
MMHHTTVTDSTTLYVQNLTETDAFNRDNFLDPAEEYKMDYKRRGQALIFNQERFFWRLGMNDRHGTNNDRYNLEIRLKALNFDVKVYDNYKNEEVLEIIHKAAKDNHSDADCFVLIFLSHGEDEHVYTYDGKISIQHITSLFKGDKCQSLVGKPKIFVLQACRGDKHDDPVVPYDAVDSELSTGEVVVDASAIHTLPAGADFIMCYSVAEECHWDESKTRIIVSMERARLKDCLNCLNKTSSWFDVMFLWRVVERLVLVYTPLKIGKRRLSLKESLFGQTLENP